MTRRWPSMLVPGHDPSGACPQAPEVINFKLHDLRHEDFSRMAARDVDLKTIIMLQSGHKTPAMLLRYLNPTTKERSHKLFWGERMMDKHTYLFVR
ncbi:hypothetical protein LAX5112_03599 [Roseibium alexandrii]|uniref:Phage integrase family protein n=1 Tax=Roseibium alexandrii TaxID=388408 RepID=A0A0M7AG91_9HYPH|nr:hypothetical protein LAX5112_03599 [Roseibium alexandrii]